MGTCTSSTVKSEDVCHPGLNTEWYDEEKALRMMCCSDNISQPISESESESESETDTKEDDEEEEGMIRKTPKLKRFSFNKLKAATMSFNRDNIIGRGGFGFVFKGWIEKHSSPGTGMVVAIKRLSKSSSQGQQEWLVEIKCLGQLYHPNLVKLIGYCIKDEERLLVYEFMPNRSLDKSLFRGSSYYQPLPWNLRLQIAVGAAKGLAFLHNKAHVIYRDFNTSNILLDQNYNPKLSDFGFAKDGPTGDKSYQTASIIGGGGYSAPEYMIEGRLSTKSDVYSFGVVLLELVSGRTVIDGERPLEEESLVEWGKLHLRRKRKAFLVLDSCIEGEDASRGAIKAAKLAVRCLSTEPGLRPTMGQVVNDLELLL
ncbi:Protein kinase superfamily protein [Euphorbia peplus]|nr:Protein kinase superfamily protein [Euphorbia peplus]